MLGLFQLITLGIAVSHLMGCAVTALTKVVSGRYDEVIGSTTPYNVGIYDESGMRLAVSPAKLTIAKKDQPKLYLRKDGFQDTVIVGKKRVNRLVPLSILPALATGFFSLPPDVVKFWPWVLFASAINLTFFYPPDYFLGGAWDHK